MQRYLSAAVLCAGLAAASPALAESCPDGALAAMPERMTADGTTVAYKTTPARIAVGKPFSIEVVACLHGADRTAPSKIRVDAGMPAHGHGMNYTPGERRIGPGHAAFDGMVFHMPGTWQIVVDVYDGDTRQRLTRDVSVRR